MRQASSPLESAEVVSGEAAGGAVVSGEAAGGEEDLDTRALVLKLLRFALGLVVLLGIVALLAYTFRPELQGIARSFVERFGVFGMALGTFAADGFHFPVPPQFYMLMAIASGGSPVPALAAITAASLAGGSVGYFLAARLSRFRWIGRWVERSYRVAQKLGVRRGYGAAVIASLTPIAFSVLCYFAGAYRFPKRVFFVLALLRIPKLLMYFYLVRVGWSFG